jgi:hypothetical protein
MLRGAFHQELFDRIVLIYNPANPRIPLTLAESVRDDLRRRMPDMPVTVQATRYQATPASWPPLRQQLGDL